MMRAHAGRGQPLIALAVLLTGWVAVRAAIWQPPFELPEQDAATPATFFAKVQQFQRSASGMATSATAGQLATDQLSDAAAQPSAPTNWPLAPLPNQSAVPAVTPPLPPPVPARIAAGHQLLWLAALSRLPLPPEMAGLQNGTPTRQGVAPFPYRAREAMRRWSADGWIMWRQGGAGLTGSGMAPASYGGSQAGAVIRYRLAPGSAHRPTLYLRASTALRQPRDEEAAIGFAARPLTGVPVVATAELRATHLASGVALRPAVALVSEFPPIKLPLGARAEAYGQAGFVAGKAATTFVDGQLRIDRPLLKLGRAELRAGGGAWGGAQDGAARVDVGPSATLGVPLGTGGARVAVDWRFRVAGNAAPSSGPAITLSAGF